MSKYLALFSIPVSVIDEWMKNTPPEKMKSMSEEMMQAWKKWSDQHAANLADQGMPLGKTKRITAKGIADTRNALNFFLTVQADSHAAAAKLFEHHPHLQIPEASIEVMEIPRAPGM